MNTDYIEKLNNMYKSVYCKNNHCDCFDRCKANELKFYSDKIKVGEHYGEYYPKIIFSGLEGTYDGPAYCVPYLDESSVPSQKVFNNHYRGVRYTLSYLLSAFDGINPPATAKKDDLSCSDYTNHLKYYCLTNIYKCAFSMKKNGLPHNGEMKENCYKILLKEIEILHPNILVIQSKMGCPNGLWKSLYKIYNNGNQPNRLDNREGYTSAYKLKYDDGSPLYVIWTYHGNGRPPIKGGIFVNNMEYITTELNPVLKSVIDDIKNQ